MNQGEESTLVTIHLGHRMYAQVMRDKSVYISQWRRTPTDGGKSTKKSINLTPASWLKLLGANEQLVADIRDVTFRQQVNKRYPLGNGFYVSITSPRWLVDVRLWCKGEDGVLRPGWKGIRLNFVQWRRLMHFSTKISTIVTTPRSHKKE